MVSFKEGEKGEEKAFAFKCVAGLFKNKAFACGKRFIFERGGGANAPQKFSF